MTKHEHLLRKLIINRELANSLDQLRSAAGKLWSDEGPRVIEGYTDHGIRHCERIIDNVWSLVQSRKGPKLSEIEAYVLLAGIYLHDIGMQCDVVKYPEVAAYAKQLGASFGVEFRASATNRFSLDEQKAVRENHHYLSAAWISLAVRDGPDHLRNAMKTVPPNYLRDLMDVCMWHSKLPIGECPYWFNLQRQCRKRLIAAILRLADELDVASSRVNIETVRSFRLPADHALYWWLHWRTNVEIRASGTIQLTLWLHPDDFNEYGEIVEDLFIRKFKDKNQPVFEALREDDVGVDLSAYSNVESYPEGEKFPPEITELLKSCRKEKAAGAVVPTRSSLLGQTELCLQVVGGPGPVGHQCPAFPPRLYCVVPNEDKACISFQDWEEMSEQIRGEGRGGLPNYREGRCVGMSFRGRFVQGFVWPVAIQTPSRAPKPVRAESKLYVFEVPRYDCLPSVGEQILCVQEDPTGRP